MHSSPLRYAALRSHGTPAGEMATFLWKKGPFVSGHDFSFAVKTHSYEGFSAYPAFSNRVTERSRFCTISAVMSSSLIFLLLGR